MSHATELHDVLDYTPYEGLPMGGRLTHTILRGEVVYQRHGTGAATQGTASTEEGATINAPMGAGQWVATGQPDLLGCAWGGEFPSQTDAVLDKASRL